MRLRSRRACQNSVRQEEFGDCGSRIDQGSSQIQFLASGKAGLRSEDVDTNLLGKKLVGLPGWRRITLERLAGNVAKRRDIKNKFGRPQQGYLSYSR